MVESPRVKVELERGSADRVSRTPLEDAPEKGCIHRREKVDGAPLANNFNFPLAFGGFSPQANRINP
jgi:hypothetical protein